MDEEFKKLLAGDSWAENGDRVDMDDTSIQPTINRGEGYSIDFSTDTAPSRARINQLLRELTGGAKEVVRGISGYDATVSYPLGSICQVAGDIYYALAAHDPNAPVNPLTPNQSTWRRIAGRTAEERTVPTALEAGDIFIDGSRADRAIVWFYVRDNGGHPITSVHVQWDEQNFPSGNYDGEAFNFDPGDTITFSNRDSDRHYIRIRLQNQLGWGQWSAGKKVRTSPVSPDSINTLTGRATGVSQTAVVNWLEPETNGLTISNYLLQWRTQSQSYGGDSFREMTLASTARTATITTLNNDIATFFRIICTSNRNTTSTSNEISITAVNNSRVPATPVIATAAVSATSMRAYFSSALDDRGAEINAYQWSYKQSTSSTWIDLPNTNDSSLFLTTTRGVSYDFRARAQNSVGYSAWSATKNQPAYVPQLPDAPTIGSSNFRGTDVLRIFLTPESRYPESLHDYEVRQETRFRRKDPANSPWIMTSGSDINLTATAVSGGTGADLAYSHDIQTRLVNTAGAGAWSANYGLNRITSASSYGIPGISEFALGSVTWPSSEIRALPDGDPTKERAHIGVGFVLLDPERLAKLLAQVGAVSIAALEFRVYYRTSGGQASSAISMSFIGGQSPSIVGNVSERLKANRRVLYSLGSQLKFIGQWGILRRLRFGCRGRYASVSNLGQYRDGSTFSLASYSSDTLTNFFFDGTTGISPNANNLPHAIRVLNYNNLDTSYGATP